MNTETIGNLVKKTRQIDPVKLGREFITYIDIASIDRETKRILQPQIIRTGEAPSRARKQIQADDVLVSTVRPNLNAVTLVPPHYDNEIASTGFCVLRPDKNLLDSRYLFFFVQTGNFISRLTRMATGAGYPAVSDDDILESEIPLPLLTEQQRIAALLDRADRLRCTRRYAAKLSETFLQSVFVRMFGDPRTNSHGLEMEYFGNVCETRLGKMLDSKQQTGKHLRPYLRNENIRWCALDLTDVHEMDFDEEDREEYRLQRGDVLICEGGEVGRAAIWNDELSECYFQKALHRARPDPGKALPEFVVHLMWALASSGGLVPSISEVTFAHLTGVRLKELAIPLPPLALQERFARIVQQFERLRAQQSEAERQAEHLFQTLLHRAFEGGL